ncbi:SGNH/GDSL hydrolase family protein [Nocardia sp. NPDC050406]|uniref:SGNH/GDSL hydrolase family protein n=1 Tax=Nocardia sp. NPDC050406 TaxID=3364318 RepID=UPI00379FE84E
MSNCAPILRNTLIALGFAGLVCTHAPAQAAAPAFSEYVALGDSWTAGVFTRLPPATEHTPADCAQSALNYPHRVAKVLEVAVFRDASCGSATTVEMTAPQALPLGGVNPPQFDRLTATTDLVTLGIGGNDIGFTVAARDCVRPLPEGTGSAENSCAAKLTAKGVDRLAKNIAATAPAIEEVIAQIRERSPRARILLVDYLNAFPADAKSCWPLLPALDVDVAYLRAKFIQMNAMLATVATDTGVEFVDTYTPSTGHDVCQPEPLRYVEGISVSSVHNKPGVAFPMHPNARGAAVQAEAVLNTLRGKA